MSSFFQKLYYIYLIKLKVFSLIFFCYFIEYWTLHLLTFVNEYKDKRESIISINTIINSPIIEYNKANNALRISSKKEIDELFTKYSSRMAAGI